jgi:dephospho-CoA kinase
MAIGITGGVATGKSLVGRCLVESLQPNIEAELFSSDFEARRLTDHDFVVQNEIRSAFGDQVFDSEGNLARNRLRELVFHDGTARHTLESILHPRIRKAWVDRIQAGKMLIAEIPLLYETRAESYFDLIIVTACGKVTQINRLIAERRLTAAIAEKIIAAQMSSDEKIRRADFVIWTDCLPQITELQVKYIAQEVIERYGGANG